MRGALIHGCRLLFLTQVWHVIYGIADATTEVVVTCNEDVLLPCQVVQDPLVPYKEISWYKINEQSEELSKVVWKKLRYNKEQNYSRQLNSSSEVSNSQWHSLRIKNTTDYDSGRYKCILEPSDRKNNESNTITLIVKGCAEQLEDAKFKKYRAELVLLCSLGLFYLLLIFFTCCCLKDEGSRDLHKSRKRHATNSLRLSSTYRKSDSNGTNSNKLNPHSPPVDFLESVETHQQS
ncbi:CD83 antigen [Heteronotia binoei]|uniref:CD83 antigen n=1 Tax=Heteronotia binoei TaxID=13085 RepID=UPI00292DB358|nr:CD83 antigen [Heteronotia binoei]